MITIDDNEVRIQCSTFHVLYCSATFCSVSSANIYALISCHIMPLISSHHAGQAACLQQQASDIFRLLLGLDVDERGVEGRCAPLPRQLREALWRVLRQLILAHVPQQSGHIIWAEALQHAVGEVGPVQRGAVHARAMQLQAGHLSLIPKTLAQ